MIVMTVVVVVSFVAVNGAYCHKDVKDLIVVVFKKVTKKG